MSFGPSQSVKNATNTAAGITNQATANSGADVNQGNTNLTTGGNNVQAGTNFMNTVLNGNQQNTAALLQPNINQIRQANQQQLQGINTLTPRGGGRAGANYAATFAPNQQIQSLFGQARTGAATALPQIGLQQQGIGTNLLNAGNSALNTATTGAQNGVQSQLAIQQRSDAIDSAIGSGIMGLAMAPITGFSGGSLLGAGLTAAGVCWVAEVIYGKNDIRTHVVRTYLQGEFGKTKFGRVIVWVYRKIGRRVAQVPILCRALKPLFDLGVREALV